MGTVCVPFPFVFLSVTGEGGCSCGQCYEYIAPRTPGQKQLLDIWHKYHLNNMSAGTVKQDDYLNSQEYRDDYNKFVDLFIGYDKEHRQRFDKTNWDIFCKSLQIHPDYIEGVKTIILKYMSDNPIVYILGLSDHATIQTHIYNHDHCIIHVLLKTNT